VSCFQTNLNPDQSLDTLEGQTVIQTADIIKCNVVSVKGKIKLQGLTHETNILFDKTKWGENEKQFNIQTYKVRMMRTLMSTKKAKKVNSLEHWESLLRRTSIN
jgi:lipopolysaccharide/colanic/teichoic acid biosynthesis glycosyltransferase